ncbi:MAG TPA: methylmalonyl-CoA epimerase [bacterium]|jgi:methylmalonyl-CoA epimerase
MKLEHIGIAVRSIEAALRTWRDAIGLKVVSVQEVPNQKVRVAMLQFGTSHIELLEAISEDSTISKFIEKKGEGLHHICIEVTDIEEKLRQLKKRGVLLIDEAPRPGVMASKVAFVHPRDTGGVLIELCEK